MSNEVALYSWIFLCCQRIIYIPFTGPPSIIFHPTGGDVPIGRSITLICRASGEGTLVYSWERRSSGSSWTTVSNDNTILYTTDTTLTIGQYMYRCRVGNEAGSVPSNTAIVNVFSKCSRTLIIQFLIIQTL